MSLQKIHLRKLLQLFDASPPLKIKLLRADIREEINRGAGITGDGGDYFAPFWADAKHHVAGQVNLQTETLSRIRKNKRRERLYPLLSDGFLKWWDEKRRWRNEPFEFLSQNVKRQFPVEGTNCTVKIENLLGLRIVGQFDRVIYPYFSEAPTLTTESARIGLWLLSKALDDYRVEDLRILDVLRSATFGVTDYPLLQNERSLFLMRYEALRAERERLKKEY